MGSKKHWLSLGVLLGFIALCLAYLYTRSDELGGLWPLSLAPFAAMYGSCLLFLGANGWVFRQAVLPLGVRLHWEEWFPMAPLTQLSSHLVPYGGVGIRALFLQRVHQLPYRDFVVPGVGIPLIQAMVYTGPVLCLLAWENGVAQFSPWVGWFGLLGVIGACIGLFFIRRKHMALPRAVRAYGAWSSWSPVFLWMGLQYLSFGLLTFAGFATLSLEVSLIGAFFVAGLSGASLLLRLTPGSVGVFDGVFVLASGVYGISEPQALLVGLLIRGVQVTLSLGLALVLARPFFRRSKMSYANVGLGG